MQSNSSKGRLRFDIKLSDVTPASEDGKFSKAHKLIVVSVSYNLLEKDGKKEALSGRIGSKEVRKNAQIE